MSKLTKFFKHPILFFKDAKRKKLNNSTPGNISPANDNTIFALRINDWKRPFIESLYPDNNILYIPFKTSDAGLKKKWLPLISATPGASMLVWGNNLPEVFSSDDEFNIPIKYVEDGFIRSVGLGSNHTLPLSLNFDSKALYFDATKESDLENILNNYDFKNDTMLMERADNLIKLIVSKGISKYNHNISRLHDSPYIDRVKVRDRVLVIGQVEDDASIKYGCEKDITNNDLVRLAKKENPNADIYYKPHPDVINNKRQFKSDPRDVSSICTIIYDDIPLATAFDGVDHVYTITSQAGFEALLRGIKVTTLGCPFYSNWGLTDDRQINHRRLRELNIAEVFAAAYILYPQYFNPLTGELISPESAVDVLLEQLKINKNVPVVNKAKKKTLYAFHINDWKRPLVSEIYSAYNIVFVPFKINTKQEKEKWLKIIDEDQSSEILVWGVNLPSFVQRLHKRTIWVEDGFIRSVGLGANKSLPLSLNFDQQTLYFDSRKPSDLEDILNNYDFASHPALITRAKKLKDRLLSSGLSKYNHVSPVEIESVYGPKTKKRVLVVGQVEEDASIRYGANKSFTNNDLVYVAFLENPDSQIIYKPHPDVLTGRRNAVSSPDDVKHICQVVESDLSLSDSFKTIDHVYTITSQAGFEALLRNIKVTTLGAPFYSGWGLTDDRQVVSRRKRKLSLEEVLAAAYILYPKYYNPYSKQYMEVEDALDVLTHLIAATKSYDEVIKQREVLNNIEEVAIAEHAESNDTSNESKSTINNNLKSSIAINNNISSEDFKNAESLTPELDVEKSVGNNHGNDDNGFIKICDVSISLRYPESE